MNNNSSLMLSAISRAGALLRSSEPPLLPAAGPPAAAFLEEAADLLVMHRDFAAAVDRCEKGCQSLLGNEDSDDFRSEDLKCSLCVVGIQALAELNRWREVLPWILQYYPKPECWPPKVLELCILLHSKVEEPHVMLEVGGIWLRFPGHQQLPSYGLLVQLYLSHVLLPLGRFSEAELLLQDCRALSQEQQADLHRKLQEKKQQWLQKEEELSPVPEEQPETSRKLPLGPEVVAEWLSGFASCEPSYTAAENNCIGCQSILLNEGGSAFQRMLNILAQLRTMLESLASQFSSIPFRKTLVVALMLWLIIVRLDPASPASLPFLCRLTQLYHQARLALFSPSNRPPIQD